jgi:hypothetical protein
MVHAALYENPPIPLFGKGEMGGFSYFIVYAPNMKVGTKRRRMKSINY